MNSQQRLAITRSCLTSTKLIVILCYIQHLSPPFLHTVILIVAMSFDLIAQILTATLKSYSERQKLILLSTIALPTTVYICVIVVDMVEVSSPCKFLAVTYKGIILVITTVLFIRRLSVEANRDSWHLRYVTIALLSALFSVAGRVTLPNCRTEYDYHKAAGVMIGTFLPFGAVGASSSLFTDTIIGKVALAILSLIVVVFLAACWENGHFNTSQLLSIVALSIDTLEAVVVKNNIR